MRACMSRVRAASALATAVALVACTDGYPTSDAPRSPIGPESLLASLNALSVDTDDETRWRYESPEPCLLQVTSLAADGQTSATVVRLSGHWVHLRADPASKGFAVLLDPLAEPDAPELRVFSAGAWRAASAASSLIPRLIAACKESG